METARSYQLVASKTIHKTEIKLTLGHETQSAEYGKIDPDQGLQYDLGPGRIRFLAATVRQTLAHGSLEATFEQADARLVNTSFSIVPEAPRLIGDLIGTYREAAFSSPGERRVRVCGQKGGRQWLQRSQLPQRRSECVELVLPGHSEQGVSFCSGAAVSDGRISVGVNTMVATGWTGQTVENFAAAGVYGPGARRPGLQWPGCPRILSAKWWA